MNVVEESIRKAAGRVDSPLECWGCTNYPIYHADRLHAYRNCLNKMDPTVAERAKRSVQEYVQRKSEMGGSRG